MNLNKEWLEEKSKLEEGVDVIAGVPNLNPEIFNAKSKRTSCYEVTTDGKTVWINDPFKCVAQFSTSTQDYVINLQNSGIIGSYRIHHAHEEFVNRDLWAMRIWQMFALDVMLNFNLDVTAYKPKNFFWKVKKNDK